MRYLRIWFVVRSSWIVVCALKNEIWPPKAQADSLIAFRQGAKAPSYLTRITQIPWTLGPGAQVYTDFVVATKAQRHKVF